MVSYGYKLMKFFIHSIEDWFHLSVFTITWFFLLHPTTNLGIYQNIHNIFIGCSMIDRDVMLTFHFSISFDPVLTWTVRISLHVFVFVTWGEAFSLKYVFFLIVWWFNVLDIFSFVFMMQYMILSYALWGDSLIGHGKLVGLNPKPKIYLCRDITEWWLE